MIGLSLLLILGSFFAGFALEILHPKDKSIFYEEYVSLVLSSDAKTDEKVKVMVNEYEIKSFAIKKDKNVYCLNVKIKPGMNTIRVEVFRKDGKKDIKSLNVFMSSQIFADGNIPPADFNKKYFHTQQNEKMCLKCHQFKNSTDKACLQCHSIIVKRKFTHPPAIIGCNLCHMKKKESRFAWNKPVAETCFLCHADKKELWFKKKFVHGPPSTGKCNICHNPHSEQREFFLKKNVLDLCTTCHNEKYRQKHPLAGFVFGEAHPVYGKPDPSRPGKELSCTSCHNPHAANIRFFFQNDYSGEPILCLKCHEK